MDFTLCKGGCFETLPSAIVALLPGLVLASSEATNECGSSQSLTVPTSDYTFCISFRENTQSFALKVRQ